jgi:hypothetical protein
MAAAPAGPFEAGPFAWARQPLPFAPGYRGAAWRRALLTVAVAWIPLVVLGAIEHFVAGRSMRDSVLFDLAAYGRYLVAAPAFAVAGEQVLPLLARVVHEFTLRGLVRAEERAQFDALISSTRACLRSRIADGVLVAIAYGWTWTSWPQHAAAISPWVAPHTPRIAGSLSLAGWWRLLVSQPLFLTLVLVWLCRLLLWVRFLWHTSRLNLRLVAGHPDRLGGLRFVLLPIRGFSVLAFGIGAIAAGTVAQSVLMNGAPLESFRLFVTGQVLLVELLFAGPALLLMRPVVLLQEWGTFHYGKVATEVGRAFEQRWAPDEKHADKTALAAPDFSATTDLFSIVAGVTAIDGMVLNVRAVLILAIATLVPYVPIVFAVMPLDQLLTMVGQAMH